MFFRMTFAAASGDAIQEAVRRLGKALRVVFGMNGGEERGIGKDGEVVANGNGKV